MTEKGRKRQLIKMLKSEAMIYCLDPHSHLVLLELKLEVWGKGYGGDLSQLVKGWEMDSIPDGPVAGSL